MCGEEEKEEDCGCCAGAVDCADAPKEGAEVPKEACEVPKEACESPKEGAEAPKECAEATKSAEDMIRDVINLISVKKAEEKEGTSTCINPETADELTAKLEELAKKVGGICQ